MGHVHVEAVHERPPVHCVPQAPQFASSAVVFTHPSPHWIVPLGQLQTLFEHTRPAGHALPQAPQF
jgi:hypothetical protein